MYAHQRKFSGFQVANNKEFYLVDLLLLKKASFWSYKRQTFEVTSRFMTCYNDVDAFLDLPFSQT